MSNNLMLYSINQELLDLFDSFAEGNEVNEELLQIKEQEIAVKMTNYGHLIKNISDFQQTVDVEIQRLEELIEKRQAFKEKLMKPILQSLLLFGKQKKNSEVKEIELGPERFSTHKSTVLSVTDETIVPNEHKRVTITVELENFAQADALQKVLESKNLPFKRVEKVDVAGIKALEQEIPGTLKETIYHLKINGKKP